MTTKAHATNPSAASARSAARETYDAIVDLVPAVTSVRTHAYALVKRTYTVGESCRLAPPEPLKHDLRDPAAAVRLPVGTDFWPRKARTDVIVQGAAFAPGGRAVEAMTISVQLRDIEKRVAVFGDRPLTWDQRGRPRIGPPERFTAMPVDFLHAYGGIDPRVMPAPDEEDRAAASMGLDAPGLYPRNPFGQGYLVVPGPLAGAAMPNLEDPSDLLTDERLLVGDPRLWYRQPLPWALHWVHAMMFPRFTLLDPELDAWYPAPPDEQLAEVTRGYLPADSRQGKRDGVDPGFFQEASHGLCVSPMGTGERIVVCGMHPERDEVTVVLPAPPEMTFRADGTTLAMSPNLHTVIAFPADEKVCCVYGVQVELPRPFVPGIHTYIPLSVSIDGDRPIEYEAPPPIRERVRGAAGPTVAVEPELAESE